MYCASVLRFLCFVLCLNWAISSSIYQTKCNHSPECAVYPNITQGPDVIWIPFFCNEKNLCACPNGWTPLVNSEICITPLSGSTCTDHIWAIGFLIVSLLAIITYSCTSLFSRRSTTRLPQSIKNDQHFPASNYQAKV